MPLVVALSEIPPEKVNQPTPSRNDPGDPAALSTIFFKTTRDVPDGPTAQLSRYPGVRVSAAHFHEVDQFQVIVEGEGDFGHHPVTPYTVHFSRAYTPYGPLQSKGSGWGFIVLRARFDSGAKRLLWALDMLKQVPDRDPWQVTAKMTFPEQTTTVSVKEISEIEDDRGLFTSTISMAPGARFTTPDMRGGDGQYVVVVKGSLIHEGSEREALTVIFLERGTSAYEIVAGPLGLQAILMNFPKPTREFAAQNRQGQPGHATKTLKTWQCVLCGFTYDENLGLPLEGIAPGTRWEDVPESWSCPDCSAQKSDFQMSEI